MAPNQVSFCMAESESDPGTPRCTTIEDEYEFGLDASRTSIRPCEMSMMEEDSSSNSTPRSNTLEMEYELAFTPAIVNTARPSVALGQSPALVPTMAMDSGSEEASD